MAGSSARAELTAAAVPGTMLKLMKHMTPTTTVRTTSADSPLANLSLS
jgi:hypothetical protein